MNSAPRSRTVSAVAAQDPLVETITTFLDDAKAEDIVTIDLVGKTAIADAMVIASGRSRRHVAAIAEQLVRQLKEKGQREMRTEGMETGEWVLIDAGDVIVHIFQPEIRVFYNLEKMWLPARPETSQA